MSVESSTIDTGGAVVPETAELRLTARKHLDEAISLLSEQEKEAYCLALKQCPDLVEKESNPLDFLRLEKFNAWAAAKRIACYWTERKNLFQNRAFLRLDLTGYGALNEEDIRVVSSGLGVVLGKDSQGRGVICVDRSRAPSGVSREAKVRAMFFGLSTLSSSLSSTSLSCVLLFRLSNTSAGRFDGQVVVQCQRLFQNAMPLHVDVVHLVSLPPKSGKRTFLETIIPITLHRLGSFFSKPAVVHMEDSPGAILEKLQPYGLLRSLLPDFCGGTWSYEREFIEWQQSHGRKLEVPAEVVPSSGPLDLLGQVAQHALEEKRVMPPAEKQQQSSAANPLSNEQWTKCTNEAPGDSIVLAAKKPPATATATELLLGRQKLTSKERKLRRRQQNVIYSRRKRERQKYFLENLRDSHAVLLQERTRLRRETSRLEKLLQEAIDTVNAYQITHRPSAIWGRPSWTPAVQTRPMWSAAVESPRPAAAVDVVRNHAEATALRLPPHGVPSSNDLSFGLFASNPPPGPPLPQMLQQIGAVASRDRPAPATLSSGGGRQVRPGNSSGGSGWEGQTTSSEESSLIAYLRNRQR